MVTFCKCRLKLISVIVRVEESNYIPSYDERIKLRFYIIRKIHGPVLGGTEQEIEQNKIADFFCLKKVVRILTVAFLRFQKGGAVVRMYPGTL